MKDKKRVLSRLVQFALLIVGCGYFFVLFKIVVFKYGFTSDMRSVNLRPFEFLTMFSNGIDFSVALKNVLGNVAIFMPFGILCAFVLHNKRGRAVAICFGVSCLFELIQYITGSGITDIDDVILNTIGGAIGVFIFAVLLAKLDQRGKMPIATLLFLCLFGAGGVLSLYMFEPSMLPAQVEYVNKEVLQENDPQDFDMEVLLSGLEDDCIVTSTEQGRTYVPEGKQITVSEDGTYPLADDVNFISEKFDYKISPNGNIQKTIVTYSKMDKDMVKELLKTGERGTTLYFNDMGECECVLVVER